MQHASIFVLVNRDNNLFVLINFFKQNIQHASKFQLIEITIYSLFF